MTDYELLELAAKAAGFPTSYVPTNPKGYAVIINYAGGETPWNPLLDDGDALRLAVKLKIDLEFRQEDVTASAWTSTSYVGAFQEIHDEARRAIVRAAAEIGKGMK